MIELVFMEILICVSWILIIFKVQIGIENMAMSLNVTLNDDMKQKHLFMIMIIFNTFICFSITYTFWTNVKDTFNRCIR